MAGTAAFPDTGPQPWPRSSVSPTPADLTPSGLGLCRQGLLPDDELSTGKTQLPDRSSLRGGDSPSYTKHCLALQH